MSFEDIEFWLRSADVVQLSFHPLKLCLLLMGPILVKSGKKLLSGRAIMCLLGIMLFKSASVSLPIYIMPNV